MKKRFSILLAALLAVLLLPTLAVRADAAEVAGGTCGEAVTWSLDDAGVLTVSGTGAMTDYTFDGNTQGTNAPWYGHNATIKSVVVGEGITYVGEYAFMNLREVTSVTLPSTLKDIGGHAFQHMERLPSVTLPQGLEVIGTYAFSGTNFVDLHLPGSLKTVGAFALYVKNVHVDTLEQWLAIEDTPDNYGNVSNMLANPGSLYIDGKLATDIVIPEGTKEIKPYKFYKAASITSISIPASVTAIGEAAFWGCNGLTEVVIPDTVQNIGERLFMECENLTSAKLPAGLYGIPAHTFRSCAKLENFTMPENVTYIGSNAFEGCAKLTRFSETNSLENVTSIGGYAFVGCRNLQFGELKLSKNLYSLGYGYVFAQCEGITAVTIPGTVYKVDWTNFESCVNLEQVVIEEGVTAIGAGAFGNCAKLKTVTIPASVNLIENDAFYGCTALESIYVIPESCELIESSWSPANTLGIPGTTTIYAKTGSTAEGYGAKHGYTVAALPQTCEFGYHSYTSTITKEVSCDENGIRTTTCGSCGKSYEEQIPATGHDVENGTCKICGMGIVAYGTDGYGTQWVLNTEGVLTLSAAGSGHAAFGEVWADYAGQIKEIVLGQNIYALFMGPQDPEDRQDVVYPSLTTIYINENVDMFHIRSSTPNLKNFVIHEDNEYFFVSGGSLYTGSPDGDCGLVYYVESSKINNLRLDESVYNIHSCAFASATTLKRVYYHGDYLNTNAFWNCDSLTDVYLFTKADFLEVGSLDDIVEWGKTLFGDLTFHGYKDSFLEKFAAACGYKFVELTQCDIQGHKTEEVAKVPATCVAPGTAAHYKCSVCGELFADKAATMDAVAEELVLAADSANHAKTEVKDAKDATCSAEGYTGDTYCVDCGVKVADGKVTEKLPHAKTEVKDAKAATCSAEGYTGDTYCVDCGVKVADGKVTEKLPHAKTEVKGTQAATCSAEGYTGDTYCADCGVKVADGKVTEKTAHTLKAVEAVAATCTEGGNVAYWSCAVCGGKWAEESATTQITAVETAALGHQWDEGVNANGTTTYKCLHCVETKTLILPPDGMNVDLSGTGGELEESVLTEEEKIRVDAGEKSDVYLEVSDISEVATKEDQELVAQKLGKNEIGLYMDINLYKQLGEDRPIQVKETNGKVKIKIDIPKELLNKDTLISREYRIIRIHNGVAEVIEGTFNKNTNVFVFETDRFSTYVLVYEDTKLTTPPTGDSMDPVVFALVLTAAAAALVVLGMNKKKFAA